MAGAPVLILFTVTMGLSAFLLFWVQPLFTKMVLPLLGGAPAVWNTAMVFFQAALLAGYGYAHLTTRWLGTRRQPWLHLPVLLLAALALPFAVPAGWRPPSDQMPVAWLLGLYAFAVGLPFFAVSTTAPLLQRWFALSDHKDRHNPYFLYGASNLGSIGALLAYPVLLEPVLRLSDQSALWAIGYGLLVIAILVCALAVRRRARAEAAAATPIEGADEAPPAWSRRLHWVALAAVPSSLLLGVTAHISTDIAAVPMLWVVPLALYLLTYVNVFARRPLLRHTWMLKAQPVLLLPLVILFFWQLKALWLVLPMHLLAFFVTALVCHGELARRRPGVAHLTEFYFWMSVGGVLGGIFNALIAPLVFDGVWEYPLALVLACLLRPWRFPTRHARLLDVVLPLALAAFLFAPLLFWRPITAMPLVALVVFYVAAALALYAFAARPARFAGGIAAMLALGFAIDAGDKATLLRERSFFGVHKVVQDRDARFHVLMHGTTIHGAQQVSPDWKYLTWTYYLPGGPLGQAIERLNAGRPIREVAVIGLGTGTAACYARRDQHWTFFEIDPLVAVIASDPRWFRYLQGCPGRHDIVLGDARLTLAAERDRQFDLLILDAFSSDAIPIHLLTREALSLYLAKLRPEGAMVFHISNRHMNLTPVLARLAESLGLTARVQYFRAPGGGNAKTFQYNAVWAVLAQRAENLHGLDRAAGWRRLTAEPGVGLWTDDYSNIFDVLMWRKADTG